MTADKKAMLMLKYDITSDVIDDTYEKIYKKLRQKHSLWSEEDIIDYASKMTAAKISANSDQYVPFKIDPNFGNFTIYQQIEIPYKLGK